MGLDMWLKAERYIGNWDHSSAADKIAYRQIIDLAGLGATKCVESPALSVFVNVAYWRKCYRVHQWFVNNVQAGKDDCLMHYASREILKRLVDEARNAADHPREINSLFPLRDGSLSHDDQDIDDLKYTATIINSLIGNEMYRGCEFFYDSSW